MNRKRKWIQEIEETKIKDLERETVAEINQYQDEIKENNDRLGFLKYDYLSETRYYDRRNKYVEHKIKGLTDHRAQLLNEALCQEALLTLKQSNYFSCDTCIMCCQDQSEYDIKSYDHFFLFGVAIQPGLYRISAEPSASTTKSCNFIFTYATICDVHSFSWPPVAAAIKSKTLATVEYIFDTSTPYIYLPLRTSLLQAFDGNEDLAMLVETFFFFIIDYKPENYNPEEYEYK